MKRNRNRTNNGWEICSLICMEDTEAEITHQQRNNVLVQYVVLDVFCLFDAKAR
jgi:hypothetical protein